MRAASLALLLLATVDVRAGVGTSIFTALTAVRANCSVSTTPLAFGTYDPIVANRTASLNGIGAITVACVKGTAPTIALGPGNYATAGTRRMSGAPNGDFLVYELYQPVDNTPGASCVFPGALAWRATPPNLFAASSAPSKQPRTYNICGTVPAAQDPSVGIYSDTVVATVNF